MANNILDIIGDLEDKNVYFYFNDKKFVIETADQRCLIDLNSKDLEKIGLLLEHYTKKCKNIFVWDLKNIIVFFYKNFDIKIDFSKKIYDLSIISSYFSIKIEKIISIKNILRITDVLFNTESWSFFERYYEEIYIPLMLDVLPEIEKRFLVDLKNKRKIYCNYQLEGQINGRMKNSKISDDYYLPHNLKPEEKENIRLSSDQDCFLYFDYKHMEVSVLEWLSSDPILKKMISSQDFYESMWIKIANNPPNENQRKLCKRIFLPIIFGQGAKSLSQRIGISEKNASKLIYKLKRTFPIAFNWVNTQHVDSNNFSNDVFFRRRKFDKNELYKLKNFCIQSPSSMICLRKLVKLHTCSKENNYNIVFHVHDGYIISCNKKDIKKIHKIVKNILEEEDEMFPGLILKSSCSFGFNLNKLKNIEEK